MKNPTKILQNFIENNDLSEIKCTLFSMSLRDCKANPELWNNSNIEEEVTELFGFIEKISAVKLEV